jgi:hypothetical protein
MMDCRGVVGFNLAVIGAILSFQKDSVALKEELSKSA